MKLKYAEPDVPVRVYLQSGGNPHLSMVMIHLTGGPVEQEPMIMLISVGDRADIHKAANLHHDLMASNPSQWSPTYESPRGG